MWAICSTKNREPLITTYRQDLYKFIGNTIIREGGMVFSVNGTNDHIHIAAKLPPRHSISYILKLIKGNSSKWINEQRRRKLKILAVSIFKFNAEKVIKYACVLLTRTLTVTLNPNLIITSFDRGGVKYDKWSATYSERGWGEASFVKSKSKELKLFCLIIH